MKKCLTVVVVVSLLFSGGASAWNALGHRLIAQIAYDSMTTHAKQRFGTYHKFLDGVYTVDSFVDGAVWLDTLRLQGVYWFDTVHYVDFPFSTDGTKLPQLPIVNALWAIEKARATLLSHRARGFDKGIALYVLLHVVGDIHQPLHAATRVSKEYPKGDRGGNSVRIVGSRVAKNLHQFWDRGGGFLTRNKKISLLELRQRASLIEEHFPCKLLSEDRLPLHWARESYDIAVEEVYKLPMNKPYQKRAKQMSEKRIAMAGCRLARVLNSLDEQLSRKP